MHSVDSLETPALLVDEAVLDGNMRAVSALARVAGVDLRPEWKTRKCAEIARWQVALGAVGGTVAKAGEAEFFIESGFDDVRVATPVVDERKIERLLRKAAAAGATVTAMIESDAGCQAWSVAAGRAGLPEPVPVLLEIDVGMRRTGVRPGTAAVPLARAIAGSPHLELRGILTHAGHAYGAASSAEIEEIGRHEGEAMASTARTLVDAGLPCPVVSVGSTPTAPWAARVPGVTEIRPGNYVFHDAIQTGLDVASEAQCALTVLATVVARPSAERVVLDCGSKTLSSDAGVGSGALPGFGRVLGRPDLVLGRLSEEHGILEVNAAEPFVVGDRVRILPNHACATVNLHDRFHALRDGVVSAEWPIGARGRVT